MTAKIGLVVFCIFSLSVLGVAAKESQPEKPTAKFEADSIVRPYSPELYKSTAQFEYEFEWQNGKILANP
ncbi:hypothetical protein A8709_09375 [Paenibacillus pectinilyticus]|uniref:Uncharacterized protein n=1 Tax=Paenibacillus pectinilyticus TaxID=512399 RepID=A0A1C1A5M0_9BACL|nr:hypothetical protein [Paenibacillus pectinilyticus]OCT15829.1 hypothetical protein A8709_09375 [Paenibacillus pectinilyticus]